MIYTLLLTKILYRFFKENNRYFRIKSAKLDESREKNAMTIRDAMKILKDEIITIEKEDGTRFDSDCQTIIETSSEDFLDIEVVSLDVRKIVQDKKIYTIPYIKIKL